MGLAAFISAAKQARAFQSAAMDGTSLERSVGGDVVASAHQALGFEESERGALGHLHPYVVASVLVDRNCPNALGGLKSTEGILLLRAESAGPPTGGLESRNEHFTERIVALTVRFKRPFIAVGAYHFIGDRGLPSMLEKRGYRLRQVVAQRKFRPAATHASVYGPSAPRLY